MSKNIVISGETLTGKTLVAIGLAAYLRQKGKKVGYLKPVGSANDEDAAVMKQVLDLDPNLDVICPIIQTRSSYDEFIRIGHDELLARIKKAYDEISKSVDVVIIEGPKAPWYLLHVGLSTPHLASEFNASVLGLVNFPDVTAIDEIHHLHNLFKLHGIDTMYFVLNMVPPIHRKLVSEKIGPYIESLGLGYLGAIYHRRELFSPTVREIKNILEGEMIEGPEKLDLLIDQFMVGSMAPENALKWFRRAKDKAVITSGDRADICLAAMETDTNLLILTGGIGPDVRTVARAKELGIPIMMTAHDTYTTGRLVDTLIGTVSRDDLEKVAIIEQIILEALDFRVLGIA
ncbi:MAG: DRTGG domain-containing protein [Candidatus Thorarchaeota archaeon]